MSSQPFEFYPTNNPAIIRHPHNPSQTSGSFAPVFIALAVIIVLSAVACVVGRLCMSKWHHRMAKLEAHEQRQPMASKLLQSNNGLGPKMWEARRNPVLNNIGSDGDIEFGFDKRSIHSCPKMAVKNGGGKAKLVPQHNGGQRSSQVRFAENI